MPTSLQLQNAIYFFSIHLSYFGRTFSVVSKQAPKLDQPIHLSDYARPCSRIHRVWVSILRWKRDFLKLLPSLPTTYHGRAIMYFQFVFRAHPEFVYALSWGWLSHGFDILWVNMINHFHTLRRGAILFYSSLDFPYATKKWRNFSLKVLSNICSLEYTFKNSILHIAGITH